MVSPHRPLHIVLEPKPPFRLDLTAWALRRRPHNQIDRWSAGVYTRALTWNGQVLEVSVRQGPQHAPMLDVQIRGDTDCGPAEGFVRSALSRLLGVDVDLSGFMRLAHRDAMLGVLAARFRGLKPPRFASVFEALVNGIACQQLSLEVGIHLLDRLVASYGPPAPQSGEGLHAFPTADHLAEAEPARLRALGFSTAKARAIVGVAKAVAAGALDLEGLPARDRQTAVERLTARRIQVRT